MLSFSAFLCLPTSCFPRDCGRPMSRGTPASENQSPHQTTREHKGVNDKQMKGRISDTCSLPLFLCLAPSPFLSLALALSRSNLYFLSSNSPLPPHLFFFFSAWALPQYWLSWMQTKWDSLEATNTGILLSFLSVYAFFPSLTPFFFLTHCIEWQWIARCLLCRHWLSAWLSAWHLE